MWIKALIAGVDRIIHGGKHYPVIDGVANVPQEVRDDLVGHTHFEDATHEIAPETQERVIKETEAANMPILPEPQKADEETSEPPKAPEQDEAPKEPISSGTLESPKKEKQPKK